MKIAIPTGLALGINPFFTGTVTVFLSVAALILVVFLGERLRYLQISRNAQKRIEDKNGNIYQIWDRYGVIGLSLLSPLLTGAPLGAAIGIYLGISRNRLIIWMSLGIVIWTILITIISLIGIGSIKNVLAV